MWRNWPREPGTRVPCWPVAPSPAGVRCCMAPAADGTAVCRIALPLLQPHDPHLAAPKQRNPQAMALTARQPSQRGCPTPPRSAPSTFTTAPSGPRRRPCAGVRHQLRRACLRAQQRAQPCIRNRWGRRRPRQAQHSTNLQGPDTCAMRAAAGWNVDHQCDVPAGLSSVVQASAGSLNSCALLDGGSVTCWGELQLTQRARGTCPARCSPRRGSAQARAVCWGPGGVPKLALPSPAPLPRRERQQWAELAAGWTRRPHRGLGGRATRLRPQASRVSPRPADTQRGPPPPRSPRLAAAQRSARLRAGMRTLMCCTASSCIALDRSTDPAKPRPKPGRSKQPWPWLHAWLHAAAARGRRRRR